MDNKIEISTSFAMEQMLPDGVHGWDGTNDEDPNLFRLPNIPHGNWRPWWLWRNKGGWKNGVEITF